MHEGEGVLELQVTQLRLAATGVLAVDLADPFGRTLPPWEPGAHIDLGLPEHVRQYSLCGNPADRRAYRVAVLREEVSAGGSRYVHERLRPGDLIEVGGPRNHFPLVAASEYRFVAGGIGITPLIPMIARVAAAGAPWRLAYGGRARASMTFIEDLAQYGSRVSIHPQDETGLLDLNAAIGEAAEQVAVYCCGPESLLEVAEKHCASWPSGALHVERFKARPRNATDPGLETAFEVVIRSTGHRLTVPAGTSALEVLEGAGYAIPSACQDGVCGSCQTRVLAGRPDHRDSVLDPSRDDAIMLCVSRARSATLEIDL